MILAFLDTNAIVFIMIQALLNVDAVVFTMTHIVFIMIMAFSFTNTAVFTRIQTLLSVDAVDFIMIPIASYSDSGILEDPRQSGAPRLPGNFQVSGIKRAFPKQ